MSTLPDPAAAPNALPARCPLGTDHSGIGHVGPAAGSDLAAYRERREDVLTTCARVAATVPVIAVVSLSAAVTPAQVGAVLGEVPAVAVYVQLPVPDAVPRTLPLTGVGTPGYDQLTAVRAAYSTAAAAFETDANAREGTAATLDESDAAATRDALLATAARERLEQAQLEAGCACIYGVAVEAPLAQLQALASRPGVRLVDGAPYGTEPDGLQARPLRPTEQTSAEPGPAPTVVQIGAP
jgi:hypothetical protein